MKIKISVLFNSGIEKHYITDDTGDELTREEVEQGIQEYKDTIFKPAFEEGLNGYFGFRNETGATITLNVTQVSAVEFSILE